jgi:hypothetical protein
VAKTRVQTYIERFGDQMVRFNSFAIKKTGLQQSQSTLQLEDYSLICSPFQISMKRAIMLVVLSAEEASFFQKFQGKLCKLSFAFLKPGSKMPISFFVRGTLERIGAVKGRQNVCMADLSFKVCPNDLAQVIGDYITAYGVLKTQYVTFKNQLVEVSEQSLPLLAMNPEVDAQFGQLKVKARVESVAVNRVVLRLSDRTPGLATGLQFAVRFVFAMHQFPAALTVKMVHDDEEAGYKKLACEMEFLPELVEVMDAYFHRKRA